MSRHSYAGIPYACSQHCCSNLPVQSRFNQCNCNCYEWYHHWTCSSPRGYPEVMDAGDRICGAISMNGFDEISHRLGKVDANLERLLSQHEEARESRKLLYQKL